MANRLPKAAISWGRGTALIAFSLLLTGGVQSGPGPAVSARVWPAYQIDLSLDGDSGTVLPGSRLDLVLTEWRPGGRHYEIVLEGIRVRAVDQQSMGSGRFTLELTAAQAERLTVARMRGKICPVLCPAPGPTHPGR